MHHGDLCGVGDSLEYDETCLQNNYWKYSEIQYIPFLLMINSVVPFFQLYMICILMYYIRSISFLSNIIRE